MSAATLVAIIATAALLGWILLALCAAVVVGHLLAGRAEVMLSDDFAEHEDEAAVDVPYPEVLRVDGPTSRPYIAPLVTKPKPEFHPLCFEAYCDRRYPDICKTCTPRMGVRP